MEKTPLYKEVSNFYTNMPWMTCRYHGNITIPQPHFADSVELNIYEDGMKGDLYIGGKHIELKENCTVFIAPKVIHSLQYTDVSGTITAIKFNSADLKPYLDTENLLSLYGINWLDIPIVIYDTDSFNEISRMLKESTDTQEPVIAINALVKLIQLLINHTKISTSDSFRIETQNKDIQTAILWTEENFHTKITLDEISEIVGYTKSHFCRKFKLLTGITYLEYLNSLRISHAKKLLTRGYSVSEACSKCGFDDTSYFIRLFKRNTGLTPKKYSSAFSGKA